MRLILWRIPRTGTTSIRQGLAACGLKEGTFGYRNEAGVQYVSEGHVTAQQMLDVYTAARAQVREPIKVGGLSRVEMAKTPQVVIVRHPAARLVSTWSLFQESDVLRAERLCPDAPKTWDEYVEWCCFGPLATEYHQINFQCRPAHEWLLVRDATGVRRRLPGVRVFRLEELSRAWEWLMKFFNTSGTLPHTNKSTHGEPLAQFTGAQREMVCKAYTWEMTQFGYRWDDGND